MMDLAIIVCLALGAGLILYGKFRANALFLKGGDDRAESWLKAAAPSFLGVIPLAIAVLLLWMRG